MQTDLLRLALDWIDTAEGVDADDPSDRGGRTRYGISSRAHPDVDVASLTRQQAHAIYAQDYWSPARCGEMPPALAIALFDGAVQHGVRRGVLLLQRALRQTPDGIVGPLTLDAAWQGDEAGHLSMYLAHRARYYARIVAGDASQSVYLLGWYARLMRLQQYITRIA